MRTVPASTGAPGRTCSSASPGEVNSTPLGERITVADYEQILDGTRRVLAPFTTADGCLEALFEVSVVTAGRT